jgi:exodeoxyribonuclease V alpha subunit
MITAAWEEQKAIKEVMVFLQGVGVSTSLAVRIYKTYRDDAIEVVRREPYRLAADVWGIGFKTADQLARSLGIPHDSPQRVKAGLLFALSQASEDGHCYLPETELVAKATEPLGVDAELARRCLEELVTEEGVVAEPLPAAVSPVIPEGAGRAIWLVPFHRAEAALAAGLLRLLDAPADRLASFQGLCCVAPTRGRSKRRPRTWIRPPGPARQTRPPPAGSLAPRQPARNVRAERSAPTHAPRRPLWRCGPA